MQAPCWRKSAGQSDGSGSKANLPISESVSLLYLFVYASLFPKTGFHFSQRCSKAKRNAPGDRRIRDSDFFRARSAPGRALGRAARADAFFLQETLQLAGLEHFTNNVATADELSLHVELWDGRPVGIFLDALAQIVGGQHVDAFVVDAEIVEDLDDLALEAALRKARRALHEHNHFIALHFAVDVVANAAHQDNPWNARGKQARNITIR